MSRLRPGRRTSAILAILLLFAVAGSDFFIAGFWVSHPMLTAIVSALVVVALSVAVIEVVLSRRAERRWRVLAQTALMELAEAANTTWSTLAEVLELPGASEIPPGQVRAALASDATGPKVRRQVEAGLVNTQLREKLAGQLGERLAEGHQILGRWAVALTASETYAEIFDQHVELYGRVGGLMQFLHEGYRQTDPRGSTRRRAGRPRTNGSSTTSLGPSTSAPAWKTQHGTSRCGSCRKHGGIVVPPSSPQPHGLLAPYRLQNADPSFRPADRGSVAPARQ
jgi:hypothetical protein